MFDNYLINKYCRGSIRDGPATIMGSYEKRGLDNIICRFERLGFGHRTVGRVGSNQLTSSKEYGELYALLILLVSRTPWLGRTHCPPFFFGASAFTLSRPL